MILMKTHNYCIKNIKPINPEKEWLLSGGDFIKKKLILCLSLILRYLRRDGYLNENRGKIWVRVNDKSIISNKQFLNFSTHKVRILNKPISFWEIYFRICKEGSYIYRVVKSRNHINGIVRRHAFSEKNKNKIKSLWLFYGAQKMPMKGCGRKFLIQKMKQPLRNYSK